MDSGAGGGVAPPSFAFRDRTHSTAVTMFSQASACARSFIVWWLCTIIVTTINLRKLTFLWGMPYLCRRAHLAYSVRLTNVKGILPAL